MNEADGTVTVLDKSAVTYKRVWCGYEIFVSLMGENRRYLYDVYTVVGSDDEIKDVREPWASLRAVGLTDGLTNADEAGIVVDEEQGIVTGVRAKLARESCFPFSKLEDVLDVQIETANASVDSDKKHILNAIIGASDLDSTPPAQHERFQELNELLRGKFASSAVVPCMKSGMPVQKWSKALHDSGRDVFYASIPEDLEMNIENTSTFASSMPTSLTRLEVDVEFKAADCARVLAEALSKLSKLERLKLVLRGLTEIGESLLAIVKALASHQSFKRLEVMCCLEDTHAAAVGQALSEMKQLQGGTLLLDVGNPSLTHIGAVALRDTVGRMPLELLKICLSDDVGDEGKEVWSALHLSPGPRPESYKAYYDSFDYYASFPENTGGCS
eukprot:gnl/TRDRNA2_/TRDRNA2_139537_c0_seq1.p1 gnl/TRDRNA2_/TRDRNA2_139537_c0~~gnl/TRDRNA2_/TRDRNA2_139537_c0_seq1.p1  ORF type:complete len:438 (+),score=71.85 gnl/TRDRNA2_/TRDRNA2_139537_c0_seq1:155-1315(+)